MIPRACACSSARQTSIAIASARSISRRRPSQSSSSDARSPPPTYSLTMNGTRPSSPESSTRTTWGCSPSLPIACASRRARASDRLLDPLGVEDGDRDLGVAGLGVAGAVDALAPAAAEEALDPVAAGDQLGRVGRGSRRGRGRLRRGLEPRSARIAESSVRTVEVAARRSSAYWGEDTTARARITRHVTSHASHQPGPITIEFFDDAAPKTVENFRKLAKDGFYDGLTFHRVITDFMIQGGCPEGTGTGGPGYQFEDEFNENKIVRGALAMANAGPNTNGSQFFIVTTEAAPWLDGKHTVFGRVTDGMDAVDAIEKTPTGAGDRPLEPQVIERVELSE